MATVMPKAKRLPGSCRSRPTSRSASEPGRGFSDQPGVSLRRVGNPPGEQCGIAMIGENGHDLDRGQQNAIDDLVGKPMHGSTANVRSEQRIAMGEGDDSVESSADLSHQCMSLDWVT